MNISKPRIVGFCQVLSIDMVLVQKIKIKEENKKQKSYASKGLGCLQKRKYKGGAV